nr:b-box zinc finger protein 32 [Quercus suber]
MAKGCELCWKAARMYCESDEASLCWDCDEKVHGANFLVARHERTLLCQVCRSLTPWKSSGPKLCPTVSVCEACVNNSSNECQRGQSPGERHVACDPVVDGKHPRGIHQNLKPQQESKLSRFDEATTWRGGTGTDISSHAAIVKLLKYP